MSKKTIGATNQKNREMWLEKTLKKIPMHSKILDAGAGELKYKKFCGHLEYVSQDFGQYDGKGNVAALQTKTWDNSKLDIVSDIISIPVEDASFDAIMCIEVLEHLVEPVGAVKEFSRILKNKGTLIITAPFCSLTHFAPHYYANGYSQYWYEKILPEYGFEIEEIIPNGNYFEYLGQEIRRISSVAERYSNRTMTRLEKLAGRHLLSMLDECSKNGGNSSELLNFGFHVKARKI